MDATRSVNIRAQPVIGLFRRNPAEQAIQVGLLDLDQPLAEPVGGQLTGVDVAADALGGDADVAGGGFDG
jgi:hypothetical protein